MCGGSFTGKRVIFFDGAKSAHASIIRSDGFRLNTCHSQHVLAAFFQLPPLRTCRLPYNFAQSFRRRWIGLFWGRGWAHWWPLVSLFHSCIPILISCRSTATRRTHHTQDVYFPTIQAAGAPTSREIYCVSLFCHDKYQENLMLRKIGQYMSKLRYLHSTWISKESLNI